MIYEKPIFEMLNSVFLELRYSDIKVGEVFINVSYTLTLSFQLIEKPMSRVAHRLEGSSDDKKSSILILLSILF